MTHVPTYPLTYQYPTDNQKLQPLSVVKLYARWHYHEKLMSKKCDKNHQTHEIKLLWIVETFHANFMISVVILWFCDFYDWFL